MLRASRPLLSLAKYIAILGISSGPAVAAEVFVSTTGNDAGDGSITAPFRNPARAVQAAAAGDTITFRGGTYTVTAPLRIDRPNITLRSHPGEWAIISGPYNDTSLAIIVWFREQSRGGTLQRLEIAGGYYYAIKFENMAWDQRTSVHTDRQYVVEECIIRDSGRDLVKIVGGVDNVIIRRNRLHHSGQRDPSNAEGIDNVNGNNMLVQDNYFHDIATSVLYAKGGAKNAIIERNLAINSGSGILLGFSTDAEFFDRDNLDSDGRPLYENIDGIVRNNIVVNTAGAGIGLYAALRPQVYNNTLINVSQSLYASIAIEPESDPYVSQTPSKDVVIRNNIVVQSAATTNAAVRIRCLSALNPCIPGLTGSLLMSNNLYFKTGGTPRFIDQRPGSLFTGELAGWRTHINGDAGSSVADPLLDSQYHLQADSPAVDAGEVVDSLGADYDGNVRSGRYDIGADEYGGPALTVPPPAGAAGTGAGGSGRDSTAPASPRGLRLGSGT